MEWMLAPLKKYADFSGRARRKEYWMFYLFNVLVGAVCGMIARPLGTFGMILSLLVSVALIVPSLAVLVRRLHDVGKSGAYFFMLLIPFAGFILVLIQLCTEGTPGDNQYGPNPKTEAPPTI